MGSTIPHKDAWTRARDRYVEDLSREERALYEAASPESIFYDASAAEKIHTSSSSGVNMADKLGPLIAAIEQYGKALDVYVNAYPLVLSPLWGSLRIVLHLAREFGKYFERIVDMFARIGDLLPRFRVYENLFPSHERLVQALSITYVDILTFCTEAKAVFRRERRVSLTNLRILFKLSWKPFERHFGQHIDNFRVHVKNVEKEASLSHMIETSDSRAVVLANQGQLEKAKKEDAHWRIIAAIPSVDGVAKHKKLQRLRHEGTGTWILRHNVYLNWYDAACSSTLCCFGIPGCGKTILASSIVDTLRSNDTLQEASIVYYYCDYADQRTLQAETILGTILKQFFVNGHIPEELEKKFPRDYGKNAHTLDVNDLIDLIYMAIKRTSLTFVIIDGLDECEKTPRKAILSLLNRLQGIDSSIIKIFISCRQEDQMLRSLQGIPMIQMTSSALEGDIRLFVAESVNSRITSGELRLRDPNLAKEITDELVNKAHGMFLWVFFQLDDLCEAPSDALIRRTLRNLPNGLIETYERILKKIRRDTIKRDFVQKIFMWLICARRPLGIEELREAAGFEPDQKSWDSDLLPDADLMTEACKGLVICDREDGIVRFAHHTVQQFLLSDPVGTQESNLQCTEREAELYVGEMSLTYLLFSDFDTQIQVRPAESQHLDIPQVGPAYWISELLGVRASNLVQPLRLLGLGSTSSSAPDIDYAKYLRSASGVKDSAPSPKIVDKYRLLGYVVENWVHHSERFEPSSLSSQKLQDLARYKILPFEFRPWGQNEHYGPYGCGLCKPGGTSASEAERLPFMSLLHYAADAGHWSLMEPIVSDYCSHEIDNDIGVHFSWDSVADRWLLPEPLLNEPRSSGEKNDQTLLIAIQQGHLSIVEHLMPQYAQKSLPNIVTTINTAASCGHVMVLQFLLAYLQKNVNEPKDYIKEYAHITLALAAANGHQAIVESLLQEGVPLDEKVDMLGETPISAAAANGHDEMVRFLLVKGVQLRRDGVTPLHRAAQNGHATVARILLQPQEGRATDIFPRVWNLLGALNSENETPLHLAARNGHADVVQVMLEHTPAAYTRWLLTKTVSPHEQSAIHLAAANGHLAVFKLLSDQFERLNLWWMDGLSQSPLMLAAKGNHVSLVEWLLKRKKQDLYVVDVAGRTALDHAIIGGRVEVARILVADDNLTITSSSLVLAAHCEQEEILKNLLIGYRKGGMHVFDDTTKEFLFKAYKKAQADKLHQAAQLLHTYTYWWL